MAPGPQFNDKITLRGRSSLSGTESVAVWIGRRVGGSIVRVKSSNVLMRRATSFYCEPDMVSDSGSKVSISHSREACNIDRSRKTTTLFSIQHTRPIVTSGIRPKLTVARVEGVIGLQYRLNVWGPFNLMAADGRSIRPPVRKCCALLAILALSDDHRQSRKWLQSCLWSESDDTQASGSLRQELARLKRLLGDAVQSDRLDIWLDAAQFSFDHLSGANIPVNAELLQGMDINDEGFEDWIRMQRQSYANRQTEVETDPNPVIETHRGTRRSRCAVIFDCRSEGGAEANVAALLFSELLNQKLNRYELFICLGHECTGRAMPPAESCPNGVTSVIRITTFASADEVYLGVSIDKGVAGPRCGCRSVILPRSMSRLHDSVEISRLANQTADAMIDKAIAGDFPRGGAVEAMILTSEARRLIFRLDRASLAQADRLLARAYELDPRGQVIGWRAYLRNTAHFQHRTDVMFDQRFASDDLALEALRQAPNDALVQAFSAQLEYINQGNLVEPMIMAERAVELDRSDPMPRALLSNALAVNGHTDEAYQVARQAIALTRGGPQEFYFHHFACMAATAAGDYETALRHARTSVSYSPDFVSPRRYEVVLAMRLGDREGTARAIAAMRRNEPDFEVASLLDQSYPVNTLRRLPIVEALH